MDLHERFKKRIVELFDIDLQHAIRLIIIVGAYIFLRNIVQKQLAHRDLKRQFQNDELSSQEIKKMKVLDSLESPSKVQASSTEFGWGKKTRKRIKQQEQILEQQIEQLKQFQCLSDDDKDIEDLLED